MHERHHALGLMDPVSWHDIQHARHLRLPMATWSGYLAVELNHGMEMVRRLTPGFFAEE